MTLQRRLHDLRKERGLSLEALAKLAEISKPYLWQLENVSGKRPSGEVLLRLGKALGTTVGYLLGAPIAVPAAQAPEIPPSLVDFVNWYNRLHPAEKISDEDKLMLAGIRYRKRQPRSKEEWELIYTAIKNTIRRS